MRELFHKYAMFLNKKKTQEILGIIGATLIVLFIFKFLNAIVNVYIFHDNSSYALMAYCGFGLFGCFLGAMAFKNLATGYGVMKDFATNQTINPDAICDEISTPRRDQQHQIILAVIDTLNYEPLQIPTGGKARIKEVCLKRVKTFTDDGFKKAWQAGLDAGLFRLIESDKFSSK